MDVRKEIISEVIQADVVALQEKALAIAEMDPVLKEKIRLKYLELIKKYPGWKKHRAMRKAGEAFKVKITFDK